MTPSSVKSASQNVFDAMNLNPHVAGRETHNFSDRSRIHVFQIKKHQFAIQRLEAMDELKQPLESQSFLRIPPVIALIRRGFDFFQTHQASESQPPLPNDIRCCRVVRHTIRPGSQRTPPVEEFEAAPQSEMNFLNEIAALVPIGLISVGKPVEGRAERCRCFAIEVVLAHTSDSRRRTGSVTNFSR